MPSRPRHRGTVLPVLAVVAGCALAVAAPLAWSASAGPSTPADLGPGEATALAAETPVTLVSGPLVVPSGIASAPGGPPASGHSSTTSRTSSPPSSGTPARTPATVRPTRTGQSPAPRTSSAAPSPSAPMPLSAPTRIRVDALALDAPVVPIGVDDQGDVAVPENVGTVGWYRFGVFPGAPSGSVVLAGHVDSAQQGLGAFHALWSARPGMTVTLDRADGPALVYRVVSRQTFDKTVTPMAALFSTGGAPRLTLITCGGSFDAEKLSYDDNVVVTAVPA